MQKVLAVFVCDGPTCGDRWGAPVARLRIERALADLGVAQKVRVLSETCFGHCREGANVFMCPIPEEGFSALALRPDPTHPGSTFHFGVTESEVVRLACRAVRRLDLGLAANSEVA